MKILAFYLPFHYFYTEYGGTYTWIGSGGTIQDLVDFAKADKRNTRSVNKVMRLIQYNSVITFKIQIELVPFKIVPLGGYTPPETLFPIFVATLVVANRNHF